MDHNNETRRKLLMEFCIAVDKLFVELEACRKAGIIDQCQESLDILKAYGERLNCASKADWSAAVEMKRMERERERMHKL